MKCGECTLCCELFPVKWLNKPPNTICKYCNNGCVIHTTKPKECTNFDCLYILHKLKPELRPDKIGIVFEDITTKIYLGTYKISKVWNDPIVKEYIEYLNKKGISVLLSSFHNENEIKIFTTKGHTKKGVLKVLKIIESKRR